MSLVINATYDSSITNAANAVQIEGAIQAAIQYFQTTFANNISINITFYYGQSNDTLVNGVPKYSVASGAVAQSNAVNGINTTYANVVSHLKTSAASHDDSVGYATLPSSDPVPGGAGTYFMSRPMERAMGITSASDAVTDGFVGLSTAYAYTFDPNNRGVAGEHDAIGAFEHEISEVMGRYGALGQSSWSGRYAPLDLFRSSAANTRSLTPGAGYFSVDGIHLLQQYNNPLNGGDAVDWLPSIQGDSFGSNYSGVASQVTRVDLKTMDLLGYTLSLPTDTVTQLLTAYSNAPTIAYANVSDTAATIAQGLDSLETLAAPAIGAVYSIVVTDPANALHVTAGQLSSDADALGLITSAYSLQVALAGPLTYSVGSTVQNVKTTGSGNATLTGNASNNTFTIQSTGNNTIDGGGGTDTVDYSGDGLTSITVVDIGGNGVVGKGATTDTLTSIEAVIGTAGNDVFTISSGVSVTGGGGFNAVIEATAGVNATIGIAQLAQIQEVVLGGGSNTLSVANTDSDLVYLYGGGAGSTNALTLGSGGGYEIATGGTNHMFGQASGSAVDVFIGGIGASDMHGGTGSNVYYTGAADTVAGAGTYNTDILLATGVTLTYGSGLTNVQQILLNGGTNSVTMTGATGVVYLYGGGGTNTMTLGAGGGYELSTGGTNHMFGQSSGTGTDVFIGNAGTSDMHGGAGSNLYYVGSGDSVFGSTAAGAYNTLLELTPGVALKLGSATLTNVQQFIVYSGNNTVDASAATSQVLIYGGTGNDTVTGGGGNDYFWGGAGTNTFVEKTGWGIDTIQDWTAGAGNHIDLTALAGLGVHAVTDLTQTVNGGNLVITSTHTGANSITLAGVGAALGAGSFMFA